MTDNDITKAAVLKLLKRGQANYSELAELSGRSRQIIAHWGKEYPNARDEYLKKLWERATRRPGSG